VVGRQNADTADTLHLRDVAMATTFWLSIGYNFGCMIASDTLFDSRSGFSGSTFVHMAAHWCHLANRTEPSTRGGDAALCHITLNTC